MCMEKETRRNITLEEVRYYVTHPGLEGELARQMVEIRRDISGLDDQNSGIVAEIYKTMQEGIHYDETGGSRPGKKRDLSDLLSDTQRIIQNHRDELSVKYQMLMEKKEEYHRLGLAYDSLEPFSKEILHRLYVDRDKWEWIEADMDISHRKLLGIRKQALQDILDRYHSDLSNYQLALQSTFVEKAERKQETKRNAGMAGQILLAMPEGKEKVNER